MAESAETNRDIANPFRLAALCPRFPVLPVWSGSGEDLPRPSVPGHRAIPETAAPPWPAGGLPLEYPHLHTDQSTELPQSGPAARGPHPWKGWQPGRWAARAAGVQRNPPVLGVADPPLRCETRPRFCTGFSAGPGYPDSGCWTGECNSFLPGPWPTRPRS